MTTATQATGDQLTSRAFAAHFRACAREGTIASQPAGDSGVTEHDGRLYVVLRNVNGVMRVYRVRNDGILKGLRRWPKEIEEV